MAAYAALVSLAQTIDQILNDHRYYISPRDKQQIVHIHESVIFLQAFLEDVGEKASSLELQIAEVAKLAEDIIECSTWEPIRWSKWMFGFSKFMFKLNQRDRLRKENVVQKFESVAREAMAIKSRIKDLPVIRDFSAATSSSGLAAPTGHNEMVGFSDDLIAIKGRLCGEPSKLQVIPIFGMGGIGKTTLARIAYDDPLTMEHFDIRVWVTVSQDYSVHQILSSLLVSMKVAIVERSEQGNESIMAQKAYQNLKGRRYLIVMDDMWSIRAWDDLMMVFPNDHNRSRIMLTTRLLDVATYPEAGSPLHEMQLMDEDQSWDLLRQKVFKQENCPLELEDIAKDIARSCRGLPLAIVVIAGLLSTISRTRDSWGEIAANVNSVIATKDGHFEKILSLSYSHLPHHLRPYFLYMGAFPEDYEIRVSKLNKLCLAEGFSKPDKSISFEEVIEECLEDLVKRSLVSVIKRKSNGKIKSCGLHDLLRDLCIRKAKEEKFLMNITDRCVDEILSKTFSLDHRRISNTCSLLYCLENVNSSITRTIICFENCGISLDYSNHGLLRVLDVVESYNNMLSPKVFQQFHLRYLACLYPYRVPPGISKLQNLQTLIIFPLKDCFPPKVFLPMEIWRMPQLRHLHFFGYLPNAEGPTFALGNLQTLSCPIDLRCTRSILNLIPNVKKLTLRFSEGQDFYLNNFVYLHQLEKLKIWNVSRRELSLAFPKTLKKLKLSYCKQSWKNILLVGSLPNLEVLKLSCCAYADDIWETTEGQFLQLKFLLIQEPELEHWRSESSHFPSLKYLLLHDCERLSEIPDGIAEIPTLELIEVKGGNRSLVESAKSIQEEQQSLGNDLPQARCSDRAKGESYGGSIVYSYQRMGMMTEGFPRIVSTDSLSNFMNSTNRDCMDGVVRIYNALCVKKPGTFPGKMEKKHDFEEQHRPDYGTKYSWFVGRLRGNSITYCVEKTRPPNSTSYTEENGKTDNSIFRISSFGTRLVSELSKSLLEQSFMCFLFDSASLFFLN